MKIIYFDDQKTFRPIVEEAINFLVKQTGFSIDYEFVTCENYGDDTLILDEWGKSVQLPEQGEYDAVRAQPINDAAKETDSLFLLDVKIPDCEFYGIRLAKYLSKTHKVDTGRILLFTNYREMVLDEERKPDGEVKWFKFFSKEEFTDENRGSERLANDLLGRIYAYGRSIQSVRVIPAEHEEIIFKSKAWQVVVDEIDKVANSDCYVLLLGETGTGKSYVAKEIHKRSERKQYPYLEFSVSNMSTDLIENELFGHVKGSFTGATQSGKGRFQTAEWGTVFLDEIGDLKLDAQSKLLLVLQNKEFYPVGSSEPIPLRARIITATNKNLKSGVKEGWFREDLYQRLNVYELNLPRLQDRSEDIPVLAKYFCKSKSAEEGISAVKLSESALKHLLDYYWPGNVRELENAIHRAVINCKGNKNNTIQVEYLPEQIPMPFS